jgi:hypothetical protein
MTLDEYRRFFETHDVSGAPVARRPARAPDAVSLVSAIIRLAEILENEQAGRLTLRQRECVKGMLEAAEQLIGTVRRR